MKFSFVVEAVVLVYPVNVIDSIASIRRLWDLVPAGAHRVWEEDRIVIWNKWCGG